MKRVSGVVLIVLLFLLPAAALAADSNGQFAVKSIGTQNCAQYIESIEKKDNKFILFGGYLGGYVTAYNQISPGVFDLLPWQNIDTLAKMLVNYCRTRQEDNFTLAVTRLVVALKEQQMLQSSEAVTATVGDKSLRVYRSTMRQTQQKLKELGLFTEEADGNFSAATQKALETYQTQNGLPVSGLPGQATMFNLNYKSTNNKAKESN